MAKEFTQLFANIWLKGIKHTSVITADINLLNRMILIITHSFFFTNVLLIIVISVNIWLQTKELFKNTMGLYMTVSKMKTHKLSVYNDVYYDFDKCQYKDKNVI